MSCLIDHTLFEIKNSYGWPKVLANLLNKSWSSPLQNVKLNCFESEDFRLIRHVKKCMTFISLSRKGSSLFMVSANARF